MTIRTGSPRRRGAAFVAALTAVALLSFLASQPAPAAASARPFHGFCHCSGTFIPDCNTSADCGGGRCLAVPTFC